MRVPHRPARSRRVKLREAMAHRALTLKYRPQVVRRPGRPGPRDRRCWCARSRSGRIAHAYLFTGARGVGKTTSARILAKALNCERASGWHAEGRRSLQRCIELHRDHRRRFAGRLGDRRRLEPRHRRRSGAAREGALLADRRRLPRRDHRRGAPALERRVRRALENARGAAARIWCSSSPPPIRRSCPTRSARAPSASTSRASPLRRVADRLLAIAAARGQGSRRPALRARRGRGAADGAQVRGLDARRGQRARPGGVGGRARDHRRAGAPRARASPIARSSSRSAERFSRAIQRPRSSRCTQAFAQGLDARELAEGLAEHVRHLLILQIDPAGADLVPRDAARSWTRMRAAGRRLVRGRSAAAAAPRLRRSVADARECAAA